MNQIQAGALATQNEIKILTGFFLENFDKDRDGILKPDELNSMLSQVYRQSYYQDKAMIEFYKVWDINKDGRVDGMDIEAMCRKYLLGENLRVEKAKKKVYSKEVSQRLEVARRLFKMFDQDGSETLGLKEVKLLMAESYKMMGNNDFHCSDEEAKAYMDMIDQNHDGVLKLEDYEAYVLKSLREAGVKIDEDQIKV